MASVPFTASLHPNRAVSRTMAGANCPARLPISQNYQPARMGSMCIWILFAPYFILTSPNRQDTLEEILPDSGEKAATGAQTIGDLCDAAKFDSQGPNILGPIPR